ncbi:MAG: ribonuclease P protein component [Micavibrio sp.]|nr:ribonuclease P protein component [Micavibrio sp.]|tara:strand:+ start:316 stop:714 length:399 start_codon:yes stop_codon:yes gene_type:complete
MHASKQQRARIIPLKKRADFLSIQSGGRKWVCKGFVVQVARTPDDSPLEENDHLRCGFTVTKRTNKSAVKRNRIKRRMRAVAADVLSVYGRGGYDYILVGRPDMLTRPYAALCKDLKWCLRKLDLLQDRGDV